LIEDEGVDHQGLRSWSRVRWRPVGPIRGDGEAAKIWMTHAQCRYARNCFELQDSKRLTTERMKRVCDFNRSQRLSGSKCSSMRPCRRSVIGWCKVRSSSSWSQSLRLTSNRDRLGIVPRRQLMKQLTA